jgi:hypothetical protein
MERILMPEIKRVWVTTRQPDGNDPGAGEEGLYFVENGLLTLCDEHGKPTSQKVKVFSSTHADRVAWQLLKEKVAKRRRESNFNKPIRYGVWRPA